MRKFILLLITFAIGTALGGILMLYYENHRNDNGRSMADPGEPTYQLENKVWENGDTNAYYKLSLAFIDGGKEGYYVFWPLYMANKYDDAKAYWDVYFFLEDTYTQSYGDSALYKMDKMTRHLALQYLILGAEKKDSACIEELQELKNKKYPNEWLSDSKIINQ